MRVFLFLIVLIFFLFSCSTNKKYKELNTGKFIHYHSFKLLVTDYKEKNELILNNDSTFYLKKNGTSCSGKWKKENYNTISLKCNESNLNDIISVGYMSQRRYKVRIINNNKIKVYLENEAQKYLIFEREN